MAAVTSIKRADVPPEQTWNRESVFASWDEFDRELDEIAARLPELEAFAGQLSESSDVVADWLEALDLVLRRVNRLLMYTEMAASVDTNDSEARAKQGQFSSLVGKFSAAIAFAEPELLTLGDTLRDWAKQNTRLNDYAHYFDNLIRQQQHTQSPEIEKVLGMLRSVFTGPSLTFKALSNTDMQFPDALDSTGQNRKVAQAIVAPTGIDSRDRTLRRSAWQHYYDEYRAMENTLASIYVTSVKQHVILARIRGYESVLESRLAPANLPIEVFHTLVDTFKANLPVWHRYWAAKGKALGVDQLHPYDIWAPIVDDEPHVTYPQAVDWICAALEPLGDDYVRIMRQGCLEERWVDYAQNEGRAQGAFACGAYDNHPFIFNTFDGSLMAASVLAHELGHAMHSYLTAQNQLTVYNRSSASGASSSVAETASNFHQAMLRSYLKHAKADDRVFQLSLISEAMFNFHRYFFFMPTLARFEHEVYSRAERDQPLNAAILNDIMQGLFAEAYGNTMTDDPERTGITWAQFIHLYFPYYTFQYSVGISAAHALAEDILGGSAEAVTNYRAMLQSGYSMYAPDLFKLAGVDMTQPQPVQKTFGILEQLVEQLEGLVEA